MAEPSADTAKPLGLRVVQSTMGESLVVALPLPFTESVAQNASLSDISASAVPALNRAFWVRLIVTPQLLQISTILRGLGLRQIPNRTRIVFQHDSVTKLSGAVSEALKKLPTTLDGLLDAAADLTYGPLEVEISSLLDRFGNEIWGAGQERPWLIRASEGVVGYQKDLAYGDTADEEVVAHYLRLWVLVTAMNSMRQVARSHAEDFAPAQNNKQPRRDSTWYIGGSQPPPHGMQQHAPGNSLPTTTGLTAITSKTDAALIPASRSTPSRDSSALPIRRSARKHKPRKDLMGNEHDSEDYEIELLQSKRGSANDDPRNHRGRGRAWKKNESDKDTYFLSKNHGQTSEPRTKGLRSEKTTRPGSGPKESRRSDDMSGQWFRNGELSDNAAVRVGQQGLQTRQIVKEAAKDVSEQKESRRRKRKHLSKDTIRNSSDESDQDPIKPAVRDTVTPRSGHPHNKNTSRQPPGACASCRRRRQRCDRARPECGRCVYHGFQCKYSPITASDNLVHSQSNSEGKLCSQTTPELSDSKDDSTVQFVTDGILELDKLDLPLDKDWDEERWQYFHLRTNGNESMLATLRSVGAKVKPNGVGYMIIVKDFVSLCENICKIARKLSNRFSAAELISFAADPSYLDEDVDATLDTYSYIWSEDADRAKLLPPGFDSCYPKHLIYENDDDRKSLWLHLHRWIFMTALKNHQQIKAAGVHNNGTVIDLNVPTSTLDQEHLVGPPASEGPENHIVASQPASNVSTPTHDQPLEPAPDPADDKSTDSALREHDTHFLEAVGHRLVKEQTRHNIDGSTNPPWSNPIVGRPSQRQKRKDSSNAIPEQLDTVQTRKRRQIDRTIPSYHDFTAFFLSYLENFADSGFDELAGLDIIAKELPTVRDYASGHGLRKGAGLSTTDFTVTFPAWLAYRRGIVEVQRKVAALQPLIKSPNRQVAILERSRLAMSLRKVQELFMEAGHDGLRPEQIIYRAMVTLLNAHGNSETAGEIHRGFKNMEDVFTGLGDELMNGGGAQYVMGGFASVTVLKDFQPHSNIGQ